jgi:hypothetical protein
MTEQAIYNIVAEYAEALDFGEVYRVLMSRYLQGSMSLLCWQFSWQFDFIIGKHVQTNVRCLGIT